MRLRSTCALTALVIPALSLLLGAPAHAQTSSKLTIDTRRIINETAQGDATLLFDENATVGDPRTNPLTAPQPQTRWTTLWSPWYYPLGAIIDLGGNCDLTDVSFYDANGQAYMRVEAWVNNAWVELFTDHQNSYNQWRTISASAQTRYVRVVITGTDDDGGAPVLNIIPPEMVLYGTRLETEEPYPSPVAHTPPTFDQFMGVNTVHADPINRYEAFGAIREYHNWNWDDDGAPYPNNQNKWFDSYFYNVNFDTYYRNLKNQGTFVVVCKNDSPDWMGVSHPAHKPIPPGSGRNPQLPASYVEHAQHLYQFAARYGSMVVADGNLKLASTEPRLSGLDLVRYIENWNEPDKTWFNREGHFLPYELAAMSSADADGHLGAMGSTVGIRNADPNAKLVMGGLTRPDVEYVKALKYWSDRYRGGDFPFDVINVHHYSTDTGGQGGTPTTGVSPEDDDLRGKFAKLVDYRNRFLPGKEVWITEFGYDVHPDSGFKAPAIGGTSAEETQGRWVIRSFLALAAAGVDRAFLFMLVDPQTGHPLQFNTSGMLQDRDHGFAPRPGWFYCKTLKERLRGLRYHSEQSSGNPNVWIYRFADNAGAIRAYAVWCPTANNTTVNNYSLALQGSPSSATLVTLTNGNPLGVTTPLTISGGGGNVTINVSEKPVLVLTGALGPVHEPDTKLILSSSMVTQESGFGDAGMLVDESVAAGDPANGPAAIMSTSWVPGWGPAQFPASAYIDLGQVTPISKIYLNDGSSSGDIIVEAGSPPNNWQPLIEDDLRHYAAWKAHVVNTSTRYLRVTRLDAGGDMREIVVYTNPWINQPAWTSTDIGSPSQPGSTQETTTGFILTGIGRIVSWHNQDTLHFLHRDVTGDFTLTARVASISGPNIGSETALIARDGLSTGAAFCKVGLRNGHGWVLTHRATANTPEVEYRIWGPTAPRWIRLERTGNTFKGYVSSDGSTWSLERTQTVSLPATLQVGHAVWSNDLSTPATATLEYVNLTQP